MQPSGGQIKGLVLLTQLKYLEKHYSSDAIEKMFSQLPAPVQQSLKRVLVSNWYPLTTVGLLFQAIRDCFTTTQTAADQLIINLGAHMAGDHLGTVFKSLIQLMAPTPKMFFKFAPIGATRYYNDAVKVETDGSQVTLGRGTLTFYGVADATYINLLNIGFFKYVFDDVYHCQDTIIYEENHRLGVYNADRLVLHFSWRV